MSLKMNELKAVVVMADIREEGGSITRDKCMSVEHFDYRLERKRDYEGRTYAGNEQAMLCFTVRLNSAEQAKPFYEQMTSQENSPLTFIFNAFYSETKRLTDYDDALVVEGYVVDVEEDFRSAILNNPNEEQIVLRARVLTHSITYIGAGNNKTIYIVQ